MPSLRIAVPLLMLPLLSGPTFAGPPEGASGKMVLDEVADGLRRYQQEKDGGRRLAWLKRLAPARDVRVAVALGEAVDGPAGLLSGEAVVLLLAHYDIGAMSPLEDLSGAVRRWWKANKADLRRRAKQLPQ
jgi:hypothetical protein